MKIKKNLALLRYPGGKSRLLEQIHRRLGPTLVDAGEFMEPFIGGGSVALSVADLYPRMHIWINDKDPNIYAFWDFVCNGSVDELREVCGLLRRGATLKIFDEERGMVDSTGLTRARRAYHAIFFCKTTHNGIFRASPIGGRSQSGNWKIDCQFKPCRIIDKIKAIRKLIFGRCRVTCKDAVEVLKSNSCPAYVDPPYFVAGKKCYPTWMEADEHVELADMLRKRRNWLLSYDDCPEVRAMYGWAKIEELQTRYSMSSHGSDLKWGSKKELLISP